MNMMNLKKMDAIHFIYSKGLNIDKLKETTNTDSIGINLEQNMALETFNRYHVVVTSNNFDMSKELFGERQEDGAYCYEFYI